MKWVWGITLLSVAAGGALLIFQLDYDECYKVTNVGPHNHLVFYLGFFLFSILTVTCFYQSFKKLTT